MKGLIRHWWDTFFWWLATTGFWILFLMFGKMGMLGGITFVMLWLTCYFLGLTLVVAIRWLSKK